MINQLGYYSLVFCVLFSLFIITKSTRAIISKNSKFDGIYYNLVFLQLFLVLFSFLCLVFNFIVSDFSNVTVYNNSHTSKPLFYKISGVWGNHEGSLLLWLLVLILFLFLFILNSKKSENGYKLLTIVFQEVIILGFLLFIIFTSNHFEYLFPTPTEGLGLNPILQDPALAIHPPILYLGYVGTSLVFSSSLAATVNKSINSDWAKHIKKWIFASWIFLTLGIMLGSIWAYYELGWGGFWFWDPVENVSLMPWFCLTALLHTIIVLEKRNIYQSWTIILSIATFSLSMGGTFLVRSGILNSIHTFANDPSRGIFILCFLFLLVLLAIFIFFIFQKKLFKNLVKPLLVSKETAIIVNNWFMMFFLSVVLIGTVYPIFLEVISGSKISIGPPFYQKLMIPFLVPFLLFMALGPKLKWIKDNLSKFDLNQIIPFILSIVISYLIVKLFSISYLFILPLFAVGFFLLFSTIKDFFSKNSSLSQKISHFAFSLFILSILFNGIFAKEFSSNMKVGDERKFINKVIKFENLKIIEKDNYKSLMASFKISDEKRSINLNPEVRVYNQPRTLTSEAAINSTIYSDNFLVFNVIKDDGYYNVRYQYKPLMMWIWFSIILLSVGGILSYFKK